MTLLDCLEKHLSTFPKRVGNENLQKFLRKEFDSYREIISLIKEDHIRKDLYPQLDNIEEAGEELLLSLDAYDIGHVKNAYEHFQKAMIILKPFLYTHSEESIENKLYYRARIGTNIMYKKGEMFHLPFSDRHLVGTQRYSIPGLPCLYLANSIYVCWEELDRPPIDNLQVSRFKQNEELKILDIAINGSRLIQQLRSFWDSRLDVKSVYHQLSMSFLVTWPLILACSVDVVYPTAPFRHEYVIPQMLLQWVTQESDIRGIRYFSIKTNSFKPREYVKHYNYVFPPKNISNSKYCEELCRVFTLTEPISNELLKISNIYKAEETFVRMDNSILELIKDHKVFYKDTTFGKMQIFLDGLELDYLNY
ncbi:hypothetical protein ACI6Q2_17525 [Chitinophagaceae bacterium LWZ2-11]